MRLKALEARLIRLETKQGTGQFDHMTYEEVEQALFDLLHRMAAAAGGINELMAEWDAETDPEHCGLIAEIRSHERDVRASYMGPGERMVENVR